MEVVRESKVPRTQKPQYVANEIYSERERSLEVKFVLSLSKSGSSTNNATWSHSGLCKVQNTV